MSEKNPYDSDNSQDEAPFPPAAQADQGGPPAYQEGPPAYQESSPPAYQESSPPAYQGGPPAYQESSPAAYQGGPQAYQGGPAQQVAPKSPPLMALISFFIPGVGTMLNGNVGLGVVMLLSYLGLWFFSGLLWFIFLGWLIWPLLIGIVVWAMVDSYKGAQHWNAMHGIIS